MIFALVLVWLFVLRGQRYTIRQLWPKPAEWVILAVALIGMYWFLATAFGPERIPGWGPQATIWAIYVVMFVLLGRAMTLRPRSPAADIPVPTRSRRWQTALAFAVSYTLVATVAAAELVPFRTVIFSVLFLGGMALGLVILLVITVRLACGRGQEDPREVPSSSRG